MDKLMIAAKIGAEFANRTEGKYDKWFTHYSESFDTLEDAEKEVYRCIACIVSIYHMCYYHLNDGHDIIISRIASIIFNRGVYNIPQCYEYANVIEKAAGICE